ncbi:MAG: hypothetical protein M1812_000644 [Candelaria pacifica]|nr:MAG: hypothetical protein M1812_000644 [Candelaria pacifica]
MSNSPPLSRHSAPLNDERYISSQFSPEQRRAEAAQTDRQEYHWPHWYQQQRRISDLLEEGERRSNTVSPVSELTGESRTPITSPELQATSLSGQSALVATNANRGSKAHVPAACVNCQKAHLRCSIQRPCPRCTSMGKADTCVDVQHKKRGRPRLRDGRGLRSDAAEAVPSRPESFERIPSFPQSSSSPMEHLRSSGSPIAVISRDGDSTETTIETNRRPSKKSRDCPQHVAPRSQPLAVVHGRLEGAAIALLNLDLIIVRSSQSLGRALGREIELNGKNLLDIVPGAARDRVLKLRRRLQDECHYQDPNYRRISINDEIRLIQSVEEVDIEKATQGSHERFEPLSINLADGQCPEVIVVLRLARTTVFFVTLVISHSTPGSWKGPMLPSIMQVEHSQQANQASATLPSLGHLPIHRPNSSVPPNPSSTYYFRQGHQASVPIRDTRPLKADTRSSHSQDYRTTSILSISSNRGRSGLNPEGPNHFGTGYDRLGYDELRNLQLPPLLSASGSAESNDDRFNNRGEGLTMEQSHNSLGHRSTKRERVDIEEMID